jgi:hypothetical protein
MQLTAKQETLAAIHALVDYVKEDEREDYLKQRATGGGDGHIYETVAKIEEWLSAQSQVLYMEGGSCGNCGLPEGFCHILTEQDAVKRFAEVLHYWELPQLPYNPKTDKVQISFEPSDAMGHKFYGFVPLGGATGAVNSWIRYERPGEPLDSWRVVVNGKVAYEELEEETTDDCELASGEGDYSSALVEG